jgi:hypothetical protein
MSSLLLSLCYLLFPLVLFGFGVRDPVGLVLSFALPWLSDMVILRLSARYPHWGVFAPPKPWVADYSGKRAVRGGRARMAAALILVLFWYGVVMALGAVVYLVMLNLNPAALELGIPKLDVAIISLVFGGGLPVFTLVWFQSSLQCPGCDLPFWVDARKKTMGTAALVAVLVNGPPPCPRCAAKLRKAQAQQKGPLLPEAIAKRTAPRFGRYQRKQSPVALPQTPDLPATTDLELSRASPNLAGLVGQRIYTP